MVIQDYIFYDTAAFGNAAATEHTLFQVARGGDATHTEAFTNMEGAGALPAGNDFELHKIGVVVDYNTVVADLPKLCVGSFLELIILNKTVFKAPLAKFIDRSAWGGFYSQAAAADEAAIGLLGDGYTFRKTIPLKGGWSFRVRVYQGLALAAANSNLKVNLEGLLTTPN